MTRSRDIVGDYHCCDQCGYSWRDPDWPQGCPNCKAAAHWVASYWTADAARMHIPLTPPPAVEQKAAA